jgi:hypothetical protein
MAALLGSILLAGCGTEPGKESERVDEQVSENRKEMAKADDSREWMKERDEAARELSDLRKNMNDRLEREQKRLADGSRTQSAGRSARTTSASCRPISRGSTHSSPGWTRARRTTGPV